MCNFVKMYGRIKEPLSCSTLEIWPFEGDGQRLLSAGQLGLSRAAGIVPGWPLVADRRAGIVGWSFGFCTDIM